MQILGALAGGTSARGDIYGDECSSRQGLEDHAGQEDSGPVEPDL